MADEEQDSKWRSLYRILPLPVYEDWKSCEKMVASRFGIELGDKHETAGGWTEVYERISQHILQMTDKDWANF